MKWSLSVVLQLSLSSRFGPCSTIFGFVRAFSIVTTTQRHCFDRFVTASRIMATTTSNDVCLNHHSHPNPLLRVTGLPNFQSMVIVNHHDDDGDQPKSPNEEKEDGIVSFLTPAVTEALEALEDEWKTLEDQLNAKIDGHETISYQDVVPVLERIQYPLSYVWGVASHLNGVRNSDGLRAAYEVNQPKVVQCMSKFQQSTALYQALERIQQQEGASLSPAQQRAIDISIRTMKLGGVGLTNEQDKEKFNEMKQQLAQLSNTFSNNVLDATKAFSLIVTDKTKLTNVPQSALDLWATSYKSFIKQQKKEESTDESAPDTTGDEPSGDDGPWRITLDGPSYMAVMQHVPDREIRETVYRAYITRASDVSTTTTDGNSKNEEEPKKDINNVPLIYEILQLRYDMAKMLGFPNYAEMSLASKMAPSITAITDLSTLIIKTALPTAQKELQEITAFAQTNEPLKPWDVSFWSERYKESKFELTEEETRPYFALPAVLDGMFALVERIFNIKVVEVPNGEVEVWHNDVQYFKVYDLAKGMDEEIAGFYLDPYSRPENKRGGAWMDVCIGKSDAVNQKVPVAYLTCNGSPPVPAKHQPSLMTFREVETLFHEFGHGLQHMLTTVTIGDVAGINGIEWDAVELPSQFMENWCYDRPTVYGFARHWETDEPMPDDMFQKLKAQKTYNSGMMTCRQLLFGQLDLELHGNYNPLVSKDETSIFDVHRNMAEMYTPYNLPLEEDRFLCSFAHIFAGGYAAGYYSYKWAEVMSADAFGAFEEVGLDNEVQIKDVGLRFRDTVLSLGGGVDPMTVFQRFRGRAPNPNALLRHNGLLAAPTPILNILSTDVGVQEREGSPASHSLQRLFDGSTKWTGPLSNSREQPNFGATAKPSKSPTKAPATVAPTLSYNIDLDLFGIDASDSAFFTNAKLRWESIIRGDLSDISTTGVPPPEAGCAYPSVVDDLYICARFVPIDGPFNVVGSAGPQYIRASDSLTVIGDMELDSADVSFIRSLGFFGTVVLHEMGHIFGIGSLWDLKNVAGPDESNCPYNGPRANAEYQAITGCDVVPTENSGVIGDGTFCGHWDEECLQSELMTGFLTGSLNPLSRITIATLDDLGYTVEYSTAESYGKNDVNSACTCGGQRLLSESSKLNTAHQLGTSHKATRRRALSEKGNEEAVRYGQAILLQRRLQKKNSFRVNSTGVPNDMLYIGDKVLVVFVEEDGAFFDITVTL